MLTYLTLLSTVLAGGTQRLRRLRRSDTGASTLEMVVIGLGLFLAATAVIAIITRAIMSRAEQIQ
jgi:Flp pilus assembly protein TadG